ncbi:hypothetical protein DM860_018141 [Cuscuta australis]|uniref:RNase H type-1 domain-containing protein n=1 Tax=Cuscuta australis TaxID=267555 RepID=A0A328DL97_9ASTE|nr:hypothetical protein DM860_018141 [Cuscuta australis]
MGEADSALGFSNWGRLWKIPVAMKVKVCLWRALRGILPTISALNSKGLDLDNSCPVCGQSGESLEHVFLRCRLADGVWRSLHIGGDRNLTFGAWFQRQSEVCSLDGLQIVAWAIWALWKTRNTAVWEQRVVMPQTVVRMIHSMVERWRSRFDATGQEGAVLPLHVRRPGVLQCFVDASLFPQTGRVGFGGILLSPEGQFQAACNGPLCCVQDPLVAEALACCEVLLWLRRRGVREVELFSDCLGVVQLLCQEVSPDIPSYFGGTIDGCRAILVEFDFISINFVRRSCNNLAHVLARGCDTHFVVWDIVPPKFLLPLMNQ